MPWLTEKKFSSSDRSGSKSSLSGPIFFAIVGEKKWCGSNWKCACVVKNNEYSLKTEVSCTRVLRGQRGTCMTQSKYLKNTIVRCCHAAIQMNAIQCGNTTWAAVSTCQRQHTQRSQLWHRLSLQASSMNDFHISMQWIQPNSSIVSRDTTLWTYNNNSVDLETITRVAHSLGIFHVESRTRKVDERVKLPFSQNMYCAVQLNHSAITSVYLFTSRRQVMHLIVNIE